MRRNKDASYSPDVSQKVVVYVPTRPGFSSFERISLITMGFLLKVEHTIRWRKNADPSNFRAMFKPGVVTVVRTKMMAVSHSLHHKSYLLMFNTPSLRKHFAEHEKAIPHDLLAQLSAWNSQETRFGKTFITEAVQLFLRYSNDSNNQTKNTQGFSEDQNNDHGCKNLDLNGVGSNTSISYNSNSDTSSQTAETTGKTTSKTSDTLEVGVVGRLN